MLGAVFYKEFLKIHGLWLTLVTLNALLMVYIYLETRRLFTLDHAEIVWYQVIQLGRIHFESLKYAPCLTGLLLATIQFVPEMSGQKLRLSLHLPLSTHRMILAHVLVGLTATAVIVCLQICSLSLITALFFPREVVYGALCTAVPWCLAGMAAYLGCTLGLLEPDYRLRVFNLLLAAGVVGLFLGPAQPNGSLSRLVPLLLLLGIMVPALLFPAYRFRHRKV